MLRGRTYLWAVAVVAIAASMLVSCSREGRPAREGVALEGPSVAWLKDGEDDQQAYLEDLWLAGDAMTPETVLDVTFSPKDGCDVSGVPPSWAEIYPTYQFRLQVAPGAIKTDKEEVHIEIAVPTLESIPLHYDGTQAMPIWRHVDFSDSLSPPATLTVAFHPRLRPTCGDYCFFTICQSDSGGTYSYSASDPSVVSGGENSTPAKRLARPDPGGGGIYNPGDVCATNIELPIPVFWTPEKVDRWELVNDDGGDGGEKDSPCTW